MGDSFAAKDYISSEIDRLERAVRTIIESYGFTLDYFDGECFIGHGRGVVPTPDKFIDVHDKASSDLTKRLTVARSIAAKIPSLRSELESDCPTWEFAKYLAISTALFPDPRAKSYASKWLGKSGAASRAMIGRKVRAENVEPKHRAVCNTALALKAAGKGQRDLISATASKHPEYSRRQIQRLLEDNGIWQANKK